MRRNTLVQSIPCDQVGRLSILGVMENTVTFLAVGLRAWGNLKKHLDVTPGIKNSVVTEPIGENTTTVVFQCDIGGKLRNPRGLLKSVRRRLNGAMTREFLDISEIDNEISQEEETCWQCHLHLSQCCCDDQQDIPDPREIYPRNDG